MYRCLLLLGCFLQISGAFAWNAIGHDLVAAIAMERVSFETKQRIVALNAVLNPVFPTADVVRAGHWMDELQYRGEKWMANRHYITLGESFDGTAVPPITSPNAASAIEEARTVILDSKETPWNKAFALRMLLHIIGDIHQPLHTISIFSAEHPDGDKGGNLVQLAPNEIGNNLHAYWDNGGGAFLTDRPVSTTKIQRMAHTLMQAYPCDFEEENLDAMRWIRQSHELALTKVYSVSSGTVPDAKYHVMAMDISTRQVTIAGCRLAMVLEDVFGRA